MLNKSDLPHPTMAFDQGNKSIYDHKMMSRQVLAFLVIPISLLVGCVEQVDSELEVFQPKLKNPASELLVDVPQVVPVLPAQPEYDSCILNMTDAIRVITPVIEAGHTVQFGNIDEARARFLAATPPEREKGIYKACFELLERTRNQKYREKKEDSDHLKYRLTELRKALGLKDDDTADEPLMLATSMLLRSALQLDPDNHSRRVVLSEMLIKSMASDDPRVQTVKQIIDSIRKIENYEQGAYADHVKKLSRLKSELRLDQFRFYQLWLKYGARYPVEVTPRPPGEYGPPAIPDVFHRLNR